MNDVTEHNGKKNEERGFFSKIVEKFLDGKLSVMLIIISLCLGGAALMVTPKEEEPQIVVPMADVFISAPGASPEEIEQLVATPLERYLWQIDGVEYVYSMSKKDMALVTVRFFVGEDREDSLIKLHNRISMNLDQATPIVKGWVIKPVEIDDVSIVNITLFSDTQSDYVLRRVGEEVLARLSQVKNISKTTIHGGREREVRVNLLPEKMKAFNISFMEVQQALQGADASLTAGAFSRRDISYTVSTSAFLTHTDEIRALVVGGSEGRPVYLRDIARVEDTPEEADTYSRILFSDDYARKLPGVDPKKKYASITLAISKKKGTNAVTVAQNVIDAFQALEADLIPQGIHWEITRNYGATAQEKVGGLLSSLLFAVASVVVLLAFTLGWKEALIVAVAVPISFSLALFVNYLFGYTINRVTLFALILSLGLVVDDPITNVENIQRHIVNGVLDPFNATLKAVDEVMPPVIMSTLAIIACFLPLFFITGMMGPYMAPMAANVPLTVSFSTLCALTIVPWLSHALLKSSSPYVQPLDMPSAGPGGDKASNITAQVQSEPASQPPVKEDHQGNSALNDDGVEQAQKPPQKKITGTRLFKIYRAVVEPFLNSGFKRFLLFSGVFVLLLISCALAVFQIGRAHV